MSTNSAAPSDPLPQGPGSGGVVDHGVYDCSATPPPSLTLSVNDTLVGECCEQLSGELNGTLCRFTGTAADWAECVVSKAPPGWARNDYCTLVSSDANTTSGPSGTETAAGTESASGTEAGGTSTRTDGSTATPTTPASDTRTTGTAGTGAGTGSRAAPTSPKGSSTSHASSHATSSAASAKPSSAARRCATACLAVAALAVALDCAVIP